MRTVIVGAGPTGLFTATALARRGHRVTVVDRDPGPQPGGAWDRKGVMQFHHSHGYRGQVVEALQAETPEVLDRLVAAGAVRVPVPGHPDLSLALLCRRGVFDRVQRAATAAEPGVSLMTGRAEGVVANRERVTGVWVDGAVLEADLVIDASGRAGRALAELRGPEESADCGVAYACREYELLPGAEPGPVNIPIGMSAAYPGYMAIVFLHDGPTFSVLLAHAAARRELRPLRRLAGFEAAARAIPHVAAWTDPARARPIGPLRTGVGMRNAYRGQLDEAGQPALRGLIAVGDTVCTTTPLAGRGVSLSLMQAHRLVQLVDDHGSDAEAVALELEDWCTANIRPWFDDHVHGDADRVRRWSGGDVDVTRRLPSELIAAAAAADPTLLPVTVPYEAMVALPASLDAVDERARAIYAGGWRPTPPPGPTPEELAERFEESGVLAS